MKRIWVFARPCLFVAALLYGVTVNGQTIRIVDPLSIRADGDPLQAVLSLTLPSSIPEQTCDVVILGGGLGGSAAALTSSQTAGRVCMTEPTNWVGGQMTSQGISAFDDNEWIETTGATRSFRVLRQKIRDYYAPM
ncbi:MAG: FAD-dependent oxidoreductase, partial [Candidatus Acidiferrum sp.]